jgi:hypothetical protein
VLLEGKKKERKAKRSRERKGSIKEGSIMNVNL